MGGGAGCEHWYEHYGTVGGLVIDSIWRRNHQKLMLILSIDQSTEHKEVYVI